MTRDRKTHIQAGLIAGATLLALVGGWAVGPAQVPPPPAGPTVPAGPPPSPRPTVAGPTLLASWPAL